MRNSILNWIVPFLLVAGHAAAGTGTVETYFPTDQDTYDYDYGYPYMRIAGDNVSGIRDSSELPSVNELSLYIVVDQSNHYACYPELLFYFDDVYIGYVTIDPFYYTTIIEDTISVDLSNSDTHEIRIELEDTIYYWGCLYSTLYIDDSSSQISMNLTGADVDNDGYYSEDYYGDDCDDGNASVNPGAEEACNGIDDNCDGAVDEGVTTTYYLDGDGDGYGTSSSSTQACSRPSGYSDNANDCDDSNDAVYPGANEVCNGIDDDCDGSIDEGVKITYYQDADGDGYGVGSSTTQACSLPGGYATVSGDCDDADDSVYPDAPELCDGKDNDCDGVVDENVKSTFYLDEDGDVYGQTSETAQACSKPSGYASVGGDCDDTDADVNPGATEVCNGIDDDCDGAVDENVLKTYYLDRDDDNYGVNSSTTEACSLPSGYATVAGDCNDFDDTIYPDAPELCDGKDNDCDSLIDEGVKNTYYYDGDADNYGLSDSTTQACSNPSGYTTQGGDCDDTNAAVNPGATEVCNEIDDDCDGSVDEGLDVTWYRDVDGDSYGVTSDTKDACAKPSGYAAVAGDCDDNDSSIYPGAPEQCDGKDNDCDGLVDEDVQSTWYKDNDGDDYGVANQTADSCNRPSGYAAVAGDCDDGDPDVNPGATEICNSIDDDCDGAVDEGVKTTYYRDGDDDGYGQDDQTLQACSLPDGYSAADGDCDDADNTVYPGAPELCDGLDNDCDGAVDEDVKTTFYEDADGDTYGLDDSTTEACNRPSGYAGVGGDCDDTNGDVNPGATEICNEIDDDCDGAVDEDVTSTFYYDGDSDGYGANGSDLEACGAPDNYVTQADDCDDADDTVYPDAPELCDGKDNDCDGLVDEDVQTTYYLDQDGDGYGLDDTTSDACARPDGYASQGGDCDDTNADVNPNATEVCNGIDDDCDGAVDEDVKSTWYEDADADAYGNPSSTTLTCERPDGYVADDTDCDDGDPDVNPGAAEVCDAKDNDCDGAIDEDLDQTWYMDADSDAYGNPDISVSNCAQPDGFVLNSEDCDDENPAVNPDADEVCNGIDDDCDGEIDEGVKSRYFADNDEDGYGNDDDTTSACGAPDGYVAEGGDCDDEDPQIHPDAAERCNGLDDDCDGEIDEDVQSTFYADADGDTYGDPDAPVEACEAGEDHVTDNTDCDDADATVYPGAAEICGDDIDQDCNGYDLGCDDEDNDGDGDSENDGDCDDADPSTYPDADEVCDGVDNDCNGIIDDIDEDEDGYYDADCSGDDCDDSDPEINPGAEEVCDGVDNNCSGIIDDVDQDEDGYYDEDCEGGDDCDDTNPDVHPDADEICNGIDDDCNGIIDDIDVDGDGYDDDLCQGDDCDDADPDTNPDAEEVCDGIDNDCDGETDDFDEDGDGYYDEDCSGDDCDDSDPNTYPGADEIPGDGIDSDCDGEDDPVEDASPTPGDDDDSPIGDDDTTGDDDSPYGDDDTTGDDDSPYGDDDTSGDDDTAGDDDTSGDDDTTGDDDSPYGDDDASGDDDSTYGDDDASGVDSTPPDETTPGGGDDDQGTPVDDDGGDSGEGCNCNMTSGADKGGAGLLFSLTAGVLLAFRRRRRR